MNRIIIFFFMFLFFSPAIYSQQKVEKSSADSINVFEKIDHSPFIIRRSVPDSTYKRLLSDEAYWYVNVRPAKKQKEEVVNPRNSIFLKPWFRTLLWMVVVAGFLIIIAWYLASSNIKLFKRSSVVVNKEDKGGLVEDIFGLQYKMEIYKAVQQKNYRLAVRLLYLQTLKLLSETGKIDYKQGKTNAEYLQQLHNTPFYHDFFRLTRNFEYTWYGQFHLSEEAYVMMSNDFYKFKGSIGR